MTKNNDIQILRAVAIILVMTQHAVHRVPTPNAYADLFRLHEFWPGVDVFLAISGFLMFQSISTALQRHANAAEAMKDFWTRRVARLMPTAIFWVAFSLVAAVIMGGHLQAAVKPLISGVAGLAGVSNVYWHWCIPNHMAACGSSDFNGPTWSLSLEWQLYAILSALMVFLGRRLGAATMLAIGVISCGFVAERFSLPWVLRPQAFALGVAVACFVPRDRVGSFLRRQRWIAPMVILFGAWVAISAPKALGPSFYLPAIALASLACLIATLGGDAMSRYRISALLEWVGDRSYSIYLCHLPVFLLTGRLMSILDLAEGTPGNAAIGFVISLGAIAAFSELSYRFIEQRFKVAPTSSKPKIAAPVDVEVMPAAGL